MTGESNEKIIEHTLRNVTPHSKIAFHCGLNKMADG